MVELDACKIELQDTKDTLDETLDSLDLGHKKQLIEELSRESEAPDFWNDADRANEKMKQLKDLQKTVDEADGLTQSYQDILDLVEMGNEENDPAIIPDVRAELQDYEKRLDSLRLTTLLTGPYDHCNAIVSLNAGAGGTESCDWCSMLYRMYCKWADKHGFTVETLNTVEGDEAGIKNVDFQINGENVYGYLKSERGVHRLVRISPFDAAGRPVEMSTSKVFATPLKAAAKASAKRMKCRFISQAAFRVWRGPQQGTRREASSRRPLRPARSSPPRFRRGRSCRKSPPRASARCGGPP